MGKSSNKKRNQSKSSKKQKILPPWWILAAILGAIALSSLLTHNYYHHILAGDQSGCVLSEYVDCDKVSQSRFATLMGVPISTIAGAFYIAVMMVLAPLRFKFGSTNAIAKCFSVTILMGVGSLVSIVMAGIAAIEIQALCIYCALLQAITIVVFVRLLWMLRVERKFLNIGKLSLKNGKAFISVVVALVVGAGLAGIGTLGLEASALAAVARRPHSESQYPASISSNLSERRYFFDTSSSPTVGTAEAPVEMIVFGDYNCGHCYNFESIIWQLRQEFADQLRVVFKFFPLDASCNPLMNSQQVSTSCRAAQAAYAAHQQNRFEQYHRLLYEYFRNHSISQILANAKEVGIDGNDEEKFIATMKSGDALAHIRRDIAEAVDSGVRGTPTVFLNGFRYLDNGAHDATTRYQRIKEEIQMFLRITK